MCVTRKKFRKVHRHMRMKKVHRILGTKGEVEVEIPHEFLLRSYKKCSGGECAVAYRFVTGSWLVNSKHWE